DIVLFSSSLHGDHCVLHSFPTRRSSDLGCWLPLGSRAPFHLLRRDIFDVSGDPPEIAAGVLDAGVAVAVELVRRLHEGGRARLRSEEHTSELQSLAYLVCRLLLEKKKI